MAIKKTTRRVRPTTRVTASSRMPARRVGHSAPRAISAGTFVTANARTRSPRTTSGIKASTVNLTPEQRIFANQLRNNARKLTSVMGATNTNNIMARPDFLDLLPMHVQKLLVPEIFGSVAMKSRQELVPYFKVIAENTKGETTAGDILNSPFANRLGVDPNFGGRVVKNESVAVTSGAGEIAYTPILPGSVTFQIGDDKYVDDAMGGFVDASGATVSGLTINYATGAIAGASGDVTATYEYDNETVGPDANGYGAKMGKIYLMDDTIVLKATAHQLACYWSIYSAFAASSEWSTNIGDMGKEAAIAKLTAEINTSCFKQLADAASYKPQFNWDASPVFNNAVVPSDYIQLFALKLDQASQAIYQQTQLLAGNKLVVGTAVANIISRLNGFVADTSTDRVGPYKLGRYGAFDTIIVDPNYEASTWVMTCKGASIQESAALYGEYMPMMDTGAVQLADMSVQTGVATMYASEIVNRAAIVSGKILGSY